MKTGNDQHGETSTVETHVRHADLLVLTRVFARLTPEGWVLPDWLDQWFIRFYSISDNDSLAEYRAELESELETT